jgi:hypothetical protein
MNVALNRYHYAVVVGINFYTVSNILGPLSGPLNDASKFASWLERDGGLHPDNIRVVPASASSSEKPLKPTLTEIHETLSNVNNELFEIQRIRQPGVPIPEPVPGSRLYIFVAGHGMARKGVTAAIFSTEAGKAGIWAHVLSLQSCLQWYLDSGPFEEVVMFADVCRKRYEGVPIMNLPFNENKRPGDKRLITYYATSDGDLAYEDPAISTLNPDDRRVTPRLAEPRPGNSHPPRVVLASIIILAAAARSRVYRSPRGCGSKWQPQCAQKREAVATAPAQDFLAWHRA